MGQVILFDLQMLMKNVLHHVGCSARVGYKGRIARLLKNRYKSLAKWIKPKAALGRQSQEKSQN